MSLEQAPAYVHVYRPREAVVEALQPPFQVRRRRCLSDGLAEQRAEPGQGVLVHRVDLSRVQAGEIFVQVRQEWRGWGVSMRIKETGESTTVFARLFRLLLSEGEVALFSIYEETRHTFYPSCKKRRQKTN